ncbi:hypothetical protein C0J52_09876 [Blattella germanica]|nr:hypothetical protein C0J52_09876 [Blattella germanica]
MAEMRVVLGCQFACDRKGSPKKLTIEKWEESHDNREKLDRQWQELRENEESLRQAFIQFNKFVKENLEKRIRAEKKIEEEHELQNRRGLEAEELRQKELEEVKETMEKHVEEHAIYENYLKDVISQLREFPTVFDVLKRYEALSAARSELTARQERALVIMGLNNKLAELQSRYDLTKAEALRWESALSHIKHTSAEKALELERVLTSCWTMYQNICRRRKMESTIQEDDVEQQLITIKRTIQELKKIVRVARRRAAREASETK